MSLERDQHVSLDFRTSMDADHEGHTGAVNVAIHQSHASGPALCCQHLSHGAGEVDRKGTLADAALARGDGDRPADGFGRRGIARQIARSRGGCRGSHGLDCDIDDDVLDPGQSAQATLHFRFQLQRGLRVIGGQRKADLDRAVHPCG